MNAKPNPTKNQQERPKTKFHSLTESIGDAIIPRKYRKDIVSRLERADIEEVPYYFFGLFFYCAIGLGLFLDILMLSSRNFSNASIILYLVMSIIFIPVFFLGILYLGIKLFFFYLSVKIYHKVKKMEEVFPEFLSELSLNLKAGQSLEVGLENSIEKEFGPLKEEMKRIVKKVNLGVDVEVALKEFTNGFESDMMEEAFDLIVLSWKKGAKTPPLIDRLVDNINETIFLRKKIIASVSSYRIFLTVVTVIVAPALFAMSYYIIDLARSIIDKILESSSDSSSPLKINPIRVNDAHFLWFSALALIIISVCCAIIISLIQSGSLKQGYKQVLVYPIGAMISFRIFLYLFSVFFSLFKL